MKTKSSPKQVITPEHIVMVYDAELRRPACVLLQAVYGCGSANGFFQHNFQPGSWLVSPTKGMKRYAATREEWQRIGKLKPRTAD